MAEMFAGGSELVHVPKPLAELVDDPVVDRRGRVVRGLFELERPVRFGFVEAVAEEEIGAHAICEGERGDCRIGGARLRVEQLERCLGGVQRFGELLRSGPTREHRMAARSAEPEHVRRRALGAQRQPLDSRPRVGRRARRVGAALRL